MIDLAEPNYQANEGTPEQLPRGAADALNENTNVVPPDQVEATPVADAPGEEEQSGSPQIDSGEADLEPAGQADYTPLYEPVTEDEQFILGPTMRPDEAQFVGTENPSPISPKVRIQLPILQRAAEEPGASDELKLLVDYLLRNA